MKIPFHCIRRGLDLPIAGAPEQVIHAARPVARVALLAADYHGVRPRRLVNESDSVKRGQALFTDENAPGVLFTSPGAGVVSGVHHDAASVLSSVVVTLSEGERAAVAAADDQVAFASYTGKPIPALSRDDVRALLLESGLWTAFRTRPFSKVPRADAVPDAIFITAMDTEPLAPRPEAVVGQHAKAFDDGLAVIAKMREQKIALCVAKDSSIKAGPYSGVGVERFGGPHPAGTVGVHIHTLFPAHRRRVTWHLGYQDVIRIGTLFTTGRLDPDHVVSIAGPAAITPRLVRTRLGASIAELATDEFAAGDVRLLSGSVLNGRIAAGAQAFLGRYHQQVCGIWEDRSRGFLQWLAPHAGTFSARGPFAKRRAHAGAKFEFTTSMHGPGGEIMPSGEYEKVMPMGILPALLLDALLAGDAARAERLGCLELDEEDLALCAYVCPGKHDYGARLRHVLTQLERGS